MITQIYEIQTVVEAEACIEAGVDHIGSVILSQADYRLPSLRDVVRTVRASNARSSLIPLFADEETLLRVIDYYEPDYLHFCESLVTPDMRLTPLQPLVELQTRLKEHAPELSIIRSIPIPLHPAREDFPTLSIARQLEPASDLLLTDTWLGHEPVKGFIGITGKTADWRVARRLVWQSNVPVILAGGLSPENVYDAVLSVSPAGADSCTLTNARKADGRPTRFRKDMGRVARFVTQVRQAATVLRERKARIEEELDRLEAELHEREEALPAHSIRPHQLQAIEELEEGIALKARELHGFRFLDR